ncbi:phosphoglycolate phosphatase [Marchantia polymorpha subsp. ruderalis]|uniref:phosphoglycolate phosphatase n=2 Tax=Marchantia polymorpha TaxID=3197 RepID=A0AAF6AUG3_MARPO|nr:hypothetical protein MARPO_0002s0251 [Marchantia polymorpha]BBN00084.1 hypothetical protein Mp_1g26270 [Marchantia polymorpha subsp. ruderalis]|eukprot:PTQ49801.1 hypothetical protein MARPO_0002s0251 [Marchantia polymorpha]
MMVHGSRFQLVRVLYQSVQSIMCAGRVISPRAGFATNPFIPTASATTDKPCLLSSALRSSSLLSPQLNGPTFPSSKFSSLKLCTVVAPRYSSRNSVRMSVDATESNAGKQALLLTDAAQLISSVETFIFDCDGVIWNSGELLEGVKETIDMLRSLGKRLYFLTNNSTKSRRQYAERANKFGLGVRDDEIFSSGFAAALYLKTINFPANKKVYMISESGLSEELDQAGISYIGGPEDDDKKADFTPGAYLHHDHDVGAVVVAFDRSVSYYKMQYAALCLRENPGCLFIATNCDEVIIPTGVQGLPGEAAMVGAIKGTTKKQPIVVGKPSTFMMDYLCERFNIKREQICMVGDNLETDILFGKNGGCKTLLVLTGVTDLKTLHSPENSIQPDYYTNQLSDLLVGSKLQTPTHQ